MKPGNAKLIRLLRPVVVVVFVAIAAMAVFWGVLQPLRNTISGPIQPGILPPAPPHSSAAGEVWRQFVAVRAKALARQHSLAATNRNCAGIGVTAPSGALQKGGVE